MVMIMVNIVEAKARLSALLDEVAGGERVVICKRNQPLAELRPVSQTRTEPRPIGLARGEVDIPDSFFDPLPEDEMRAFTEGTVYPKSASTSTRVSEESPVHKASKKRAPGKGRRRRAR